MANMQLTGVNETLLTNSEPVRQQFGIADMAIVINLLTKLYSNPIRTLTQEYISNARDANREVSSKRKIEITSPSRFAPMMSIRDFGPGLSPDRISSVFLLYGASTKRTSNSQTGGFGIGAKSGWAYTDSFNIVTYVDGFKRTYIAHKSHGNGNLDLISEEKTLEPNGTEIQIAVNPMDVGRFKEAILRTVFFWSEHEMPVLKGMVKEDIVPKTVQFKLDNYEVLTLPNFLGNESSYIIVDGIPYPNRDYTPLTRAKSKLNFAISIPNSKVNIAPNREELINDDITKQFLKDTDKSISNKIQAHLNSKVNTHSQLNDALREGIELYKMFQFDFKFKNYSLNWNGLSAHDKQGNNINFGHTYEMRRGNKLHRRDYLTSIHIEAIDKVYYNDMPNEAATKIVWRIKKLLANGRRVDLMRNDIDQEILDDLKPIPLSSIDASDYKQFRAAKAATKKLEICLHHFNGHYGSLKPTQTTIANLTKPVVYALFGSSEYKIRHSGEFADWLRIIFKQDKDFAFIATGSEHMIASNPNFIKYEDFVKTYKPSDSQVLYMINKQINEHNNAYGVRKFTKLVKDITNDSFKYILDTLNHTFKDETEIPKKIYDTLQDHKIVKEYKKHAKFLDQFEAKYPLICDIESDKLTKSHVRKEVIDYINGKA